MIVTLASFKGGVGKSTTAIHIAAILQQFGPTLLVDSDKVNRSALHYHKRSVASGRPLPFLAIDDFLLAREGPKHQHIVIDTKAAPDPEDLKNIIVGSDILIVPTEPDMMALDSVVQAAATLHELRPDSFRILLTKVPPPPQKDGAEARATLEGLGLPLFKRHIRLAKAFRVAADTGLTVDMARKFDNSSLAFNDYEEVMREIQTILNHDQRAPQNEVPANV